MTYRTEYSMIAVHDIGARAEQECACPGCTFGLALGDALVADEGAICKITIYLARRNEARQNRFPQAKEAQEHRILFECAMLSKSNVRQSSSDSLITCTGGLQGTPFRVGTPQTDNYVTTNWTSTIILTPNAPSMKGTGSMALIRRGSALVIGTSRDTWPSCLSMVRNLKFFIFSSAISRGFSPDHAHIPLSFFHQSCHLRKRVEHDRPSGTCNILTRQSDQHFCVQHISKTRGVSI